MLQIPSYKFRDLALNIVPIITFLMFLLSECATHWDTKQCGNGNIDSNTCTWCPPAILFLLPLLRSLCHIFMLKHQLVCPFHLFLNSMLGIKKTTFPWQYLCWYPWDSHIQNTDEKIVNLCIVWFFKHIQHVLYLHSTYASTHKHHWNACTTRLLEGLGLLLGLCLLPDRINKCFSTACGLHAEQSVKLSFLLPWSKQMLVLIHLPQLHIPSAPWA